MFGLFTQSKETPAVAAALAQALRENDTQIAVSDFLDAIRRSPADLRELRETCRKTVIELCAKTSIKNAAQQRELCSRAAADFDTYLSQAITDYLRECRAEKSASASKERGFVIEFAPF